MACETALPSQRPMLSEIVDDNSTADQGTDGKKPFRCRFTAKREFIDVMSLVDEGKM